jgi:hypothetical protein
MAIMIDNNTAITELLALNHCRVYLQVTTILDVTSGDGLRISSSSIEGDHDSEQPHYYQWPYQPKPGAAGEKLYVGMCMMHGTSLISHWAIGLTKTKNGHGITLIKTNDYMNALSTDGKSGFPIGPFEQLTDSSKEPTLSKLFQQCQELLYIDKVTSSN